MFQLVLCTDSHTLHPYSMEIVSYEDLTNSEKFGHGTLLQVLIIHYLGNLNFTSLRAILMRNHVYAQ